MHTLDNEYFRFLNFVLTNQNLKQNNGSVSQNLDLNPARVTESWSVLNEMRASENLKDLQWVMDGLKLSC